MKKPADLLTPGRWLCCVIGLMWLAGMLCHYFGAEAAVPWLLWAGVILSAALLGMLGGVVYDLLRPLRRDRLIHLTDRAAFAGTQA